MRQSGTKKCETNRCQLGTIDAERLEQERHFVALDHTRLVLVYTTRLLSDRTHTIVERTPRFACSPAFSK